MDKKNQLDVTFCILYFSSILLQITLELPSQTYNNTFTSRSNTVIEGSAAMIKILTTRITDMTGLPHTNYITRLQFERTIR